MCCVRERKGMGYLYCNCVLWESGKVMGYLYCNCVLWESGKGWDIFTVIVLWESGKGVASVNRQ